jgi:hypothetical protein
VQIAGHGAIEITPFPIRPLFPGVASSLFVRDSKPFTDAPQLLLAGEDANGPAEFVIESEYDPGLERCLLALFAFASLQRLECAAKDNREVMNRCIALSIESGVLCTQTAFVGFSEKIYRAVVPEWDDCELEGRQFCDAPITRPAPPRSQEVGILPPLASGPSRSPPPDFDAPQTGLWSQVIDQQDIGGWWRVAGPLLDLVHGTLPAFLEAELPGGVKRNEIIATIVALAILRKKCGDDQAIWKLIEKKAINWLRARRIEYEGLIGRMMASLAD